MEQKLNDKRGEEKEKKPSGKQSNMLLSLSDSICPMAAF